MELRYDMRKGFFFTLLIFIFFFLVLISVTAWTRIRETQEEQVVVSMRINKMNEFAEMVKEDAERTTILCGASALRVAVAYVAYNNESKFLNRAECFHRDCVYELMYNATIGGKENYTKMDGNNVSLSSPEQMGTITLRNWDERIKKLGEKAGFNVSIYRDNVGIYQSDPWNVKIGYNLHVNVTDKALDSVFRRDIIPILVTIPLTNYTYGG